MKVINGAVEMVPIENLTLHPRNVNEGDVGAIHQSIEANGFYGTIVAQKSTGHVLAGNHRLIAAQQSGATELPVVWVDVDDAHALRILLADNRTTRLGMDDPEALADLLQEIIADQGSLDGTGYDGDALDELLADLGREDDGPVDPGAQIDRAEELRDEWGTERGQVWEIPSVTVPGKSHRLMCGDSTSPEDVERLMGGEKAGMLWSDPPYGLGGYAGRGGTLTAVEGDDANPEQLRAFFGAWSAPEEYVCCEFKTYHHLLKARGTPRSLIVWAKQVFGMGSGYRRQHEFIGYYGSFKGTTESDLWQENRGGGYDHPTQKPPALPARAMRNSAERGGLVADPFAGSGPSFVAGEQEGRVVYGMEWEPKYVAVILQRLADMGMEPRLAGEPAEAVA